MENYAIEMLNITKTFSGKAANDNISIQLRKGEIHALLGENGAVLQVDVNLPPKELYILPYSQQAKESLAFIKKEIDAKLPDIWYQPNMVGVSPFPKCEEEFEMIEALLEENTDKLPDTQVYRHIDCFDIIPVGIDKRAGVNFLAQKLNLMRDEIVAVGDSMNDYPMFAYAGLSLGVNVGDESQINKNFKTITEVLDYLDAKPESDDWYTLALEDMDEFVELQGIYLRQ
jgi:hydroxymethylpyrimidine pyrophosphatase-like HAD family hydrolase